MFIKLLIYLILFGCIFNKSQTFLLNKYTDITKNILFALPEVKTVDHRGGNYVEQQGDVKLL